MSTFATPSPSKISRYSRYGSWQVLAEADFRRGLVTDTAPVAVPAGGIVDASDYLFDRPGKIRKRGGTVYNSAALGSANSLSHVYYAPFSSGTRLIAIASTFGDFASYRAWDTGFGANIGAVNGITANPLLFYNDSLYLLEGGSGGVPALVKNAAGTCTIAASAAPATLIGATHAGYLVLANDNATHKNRLWFSPIPNPETTWDLANAYIDTASPITGLASVQGVLIVFHAGTSERVLGSIPPGTPGENMSLQPLSGQAGCIDAGSIRPLAGNIYFADSSGVWVTNGASVTSTTARADATGISSLWRTRLASAVASGSATVRAGTFGSDYYMVQILATGGAGFVNTLYLVYHVSTGIWSKLTMPPIADYTPNTDSLETYAAPVHAGQVLQLSDLFVEAPTQSQDADGTVVAPTITSRVMGSGPFEKAFGDGHLTYDMRSSSGATLALTYSRDIEQQSFQSSFTFAGVAAPTRQRFPVSGDGHGFTWKITQSGASTKTELYAVELEHRNYEEQADG